ncbi:hypothetical protein V757_01135 [Pelistega indica]|uniref:Phage protein Gp138 N-terminal domain-containing protein n=1 Tax=Pelistega indica TaxID=1414851 RepID=V8G8Z6_9BURK|nr:MULTISPECIES: Gp138 family membrane-puncturing spike protein [Pelistega]ETD72974.1 hypothetical protein V757_01135 [Pelistega indica]
MSDYSYHNATVESAVDAQTEKAIKDIHTSLPAKVIDFNSTLQTVTLAAQVKQILIDGKTVQIPPLMDVPVNFPRGGGFAVTFPLQAGDEGIAIFSERCIDGWHTSGKATEPLDYRFCDLSDAMFIPGICSRPNTIKGFFTDGLSLQTLDGSTFIRITNGKILIKGEIEQNGGFVSSADVVASGISLTNHVHGGVSSGGSKTSGPQ